jgi:hypothetical protein
VNGQPAIGNLLLDHNKMPMHGTECIRVVAPPIADGAKSRTSTRAISATPLPVAELGSPHRAGPASINDGRPASPASTARRVNLPLLP